MIYDEIFITFKNTDKIPEGFMNVGPGSYKFVAYGGSTWLEITLSDGRESASISADEIYSVFGKNPPLN